jgi:peroxidase
MIRTKRQKRTARRPAGGRQRGFQLHVELLEERCVLDVRSFSGVGNNIVNPNFGAAGEDLLRLSPAANRPVAFGGDGLNSPSMHYAAPDFIAGPRLVSNFVSNQATELFGPVDINTVNQNTLSDFGYTWGQFLDHDMDLTPDQTGQPRPDVIEPPFVTTDFDNGFPIPADPEHPDDPIGSLRFSRSVFNLNTGNPGPDGETGTADDVPREQPNVVSSFLDLSQVYGSNEFIARALRRLSGGRMKTSAGNMLPFNNLDFFTQAELDALHMANDAHVVPNSELYAAGDVRANETIELTTLHTLFVRNHNRIAGLVAPRYAHIGNAAERDEAIFQEARRLNIAQYQNITYAGYLPALLGPDALPAFTGYDPTVNPTISTEFSTIAFRFGHSTLNNIVPRDNNNGNPIDDPVGLLGLAENFFNPRLLTNTGAIDPVTGHRSTNIGPILKGDADHNAQANDVLAISGIRNLLFGQGGPGEDLIARDIWRADDHGIGTYNQVRVAFGLPPITNTGAPTHGFEQIGSDVGVQQNLFTAFADPAIRPTFLPGVDGVLGTADDKFAGDINPFIAGLAEDHVPGSDMGPLFHAILVDQFTRLRDGDRFFFLNESFDAEELAIIGEGDTLAEAIMANTSITNLQADVFIFQVSITGTVFDDRDKDGVRDPGEPGVANQRVRLIDRGGGERVTVRTDAQGNYRFDVFNGLGVGDWRVRLVDVPPGQSTTPDIVNVSITRGDVHLQVNFGMKVPGDGDSLSGQALATDGDGGTAASLDVTALPDVPLLVTAPFQGTSFTPVTVASGEEDQPIWLSSGQPLLPTSGEDAAATLVADDTLQEEQTVAVFDMVLGDLELGLFMQDLLNDLVPAL